MEIDGSVEGDVTVEESLSEHGDEVPADGQQHVGEQEGDGGGRTSGHHYTHHRGLWEPGRVGLKTIV